MEDELEVAEAHPLGVSLMLFLDQLSAVRDLTDTVEANKKLFESHAKRVWRAASRILPNATEKQVERAASMIEESFAKLDSIHEDINSELFEKIWEVNTEPDDASQDRDSNADALIVAKRAELQSIMHNMVEEVRIVAKSPEDFQQLVQIVATEKRARPPDTFLLLSALLTTCIATFEVFFSGVVHWFYTERPDALRSSDPQISWEELSEYRSIEEFREYYIDRQVSNVLRGGLEEWEKWLAQKLKISLSQAYTGFNFVQELFQRRHVVVHSGGRVSRQYINKVRANGDPPELGTLLHVDRAYLDAGICRLTALGIILTFELLLKFKVQEVTPHLSADDFINGCVYTELESGRNTAALEIGEILHPKIRSSAAKLMLTVNCWIARKRLYGLTDIHNEVRSWDTSTLSSVYKAAKLALLDKHSDAYDLVQLMLANNELDESHWVKWPVFEGVREYVEQREKARLADEVHRHDQT